MAYACQGPSMGSLVPGSQSSERTSPAQRPSWIRGNHFCKMGLGRVELSTALIRFLTKALETDAAPQVVDRPRDLPALQALGTGRFRFESTPEVTLPPSSALEPLKHLHEVSRGSDRTRTSDRNFRRSAGRRRAPGTPQWPDSSESDPHRPAGRPACRFSFWAPW